MISMEDQEYENVEIKLRALSLKYPEVASIIDNTIELVKTKQKIVKEGARLAGQAMKLGQPTVIKSVSVSELINDYLKRHPEINFSKMVTELIENHIGTTENSAEPIVILTQIESCEKRIAKLKENAKYKKMKHRIERVKQFGYVSEDDKEFWENHPKNFIYHGSQEHNEDLKVVEIFEAKIAKFEERITQLKAALLSSSKRKKKL